MVEYDRRFIWSDRLYNKNYIESAKLYQKILDRKEFLLALTGGTTMPLTRPPHTYSVHGWQRLTFVVVLGHGSRRFARII